MLSFDKEFNLEVTPRVQENMQHAKNKIKEEMDSGEIGYYKLPQNSTHLVEDANALELDGIKQVVVIGIGGSSLGIKAIDSILRPITPHAKEILYFENSDPITISSTMN